MTFIHQTVATGSRHDGQHWTLTCENCGARGPFADRMQECVDKWNAPGIKHNKLVEAAETAEKEIDRLKDGIDGSQFQWKTVSVKMNPKIRRRTSSSAGCHCLKRPR